MKAAPFGAAFLLVAYHAIPHMQLNMQGKCYDYSEWQTGVQRLPPRRRGFIANRKEKSPDIVGTFL